MSETIKKVVSFRCGIGENLIGFISSENGGRQNLLLPHRPSPKEVIGRAISISVRDVGF